MCAFNDLVASPTEDHNENVQSHQACQGDTAVMQLGGLLIKNPWMKLEKHKIPKESRGVVVNVGGRSGGLLKWVNTSPECVC